jgi:hypothetical protein
MILSGIMTFYLESIRQAWEFVLESGAGIGLVLILRWYWWRINAWSEIAAMVAAAIGYAAIKIFTTIVFPHTLLLVVALTTLCWIVVTLATPPEPDAHLVAFYRRTRPDGPGWTRIAALAGEPPPAPLRGLFVDWAAGVLVVYSALFGIGHALFGSTMTALVFLVAALCGISVLVRRSRNA